MILMPLTFSITVGIGAAFVAGSSSRSCSASWASIHWLMWIVFIAFVVYFAQSWLNTIL